MAHESKAAARIGVLALIALLSACAGTGDTIRPGEEVAAGEPVIATPVPTPTSVPSSSAASPTSWNEPAIPIQRHVWSTLTAGPAAPWKGPEFGMYTYVLFNGPVTNPVGYEDQIALNRLNVLLKTILSMESATTPVSEETRRETNVFLIPAGRKSAGAADMVYYRDVSDLYRIYFRVAFNGNKVLSQRISPKRHGPFLLATLQPITRTVTPKPGKKGYVVDSKQPILLVDLTGANEKSVAEVVRTFKAHVADGPLTKTDLPFERLRLKLVSLLLDLNDAIPLVRNAVAGTCKTVGIEKGCMQ